MRFDPSVYCGLVLFWVDFAKYVTNTYLLIYNTAKKGNSLQWFVLTMFIVAFVITVGLLWVVLITLRVRSKYGDPKIHRGNTYIQTNQYIFPVYISLYI